MKKFKPFSWIPVIAIIITGLLFTFSPQIATWHYQRTIRQSTSYTNKTSKQEAASRLDRNFAIQKQIFQIFGGFALLVGIWVTWRRVRVAEKTLDATNRNLEITEAGHFIERYTKAIEHLGSKETAVQLGGVFALEKLAKDRKEYHNTIFETLCAFVRDNEKYTLFNREKPYTSVNEDDTTDRERPVSAVISAIISVIGRRDQTREEYDYLIDLNGVDLSSYDFRQPSAIAYFANANFSNSKLRHADFRHLNLTGARFHAVRAQGIKFSGSLLDHADFTGAWLKDVYFINAQLNNIVFYNTKMHDAVFTGATMRNAILLNTKMPETEFKDADVRGTIFANAELKQSHFANTRLKETHFRSTSLMTISFDEEDFLAVSTLYNCKLEDKLREFITKEKPELLEKPEGEDVEHTNRRIEKLLTGGVY